jgi:HSP20 family molecular chaperone IbpA
MQMNNKENKLHYQSPIRKEFISNVRSEFRYALEPYPEVLAYTESLEKSLALLEKIVEDYQTKLNTPENQNAESIYKHNIKVLAENDNLKKECEKSHTLIEDLKKHKRDLEKAIDLNTSTLLIQDQKINTLINNGICTFANPEKFYDAIVNTKTFNKLLKGTGWDIKKNVNSQFAKVGANSIQVNIMGNFNKGKSFLLSFLSGRTLPAGYNVHTKGISCIYPEDVNIPITYLDSAGFDEPLKMVKYVAEYAKSKVKQSKLSDTDQQKMIEDNKVNIFSAIASEAPKADDPKLEESKSETSPKFDESEIVHQFLKDKNYIEHLIQSFLIETSDVFLIVVSQLTFTDEKLIHRMKEYKGKKKIYIIHNYNNLSTKEDVKKFIEKDIIKSFSVTKMKYAKNLGINVNQEYFVDNESSDFIHVVIARDGSEAGDYYNISAREMIITSICDKSSNQKLFKLEEDLVKYLNAHLSDYLQGASDNCIGIEDIEVRNDDVGETLVKVGSVKPKADCKKLESLEFRPASFDQYGYLDMFQLQSKSTTLPYAIYETKDELVWLTELTGFCPEDFKLKKIAYKPEEIDSNFYFTLVGTKDPIENNQNVYKNTIQSGSINFRSNSIPLKKLLELETPIEKCKPTLQNGLLECRRKKKHKEPVIFEF